MIKLPGGEPTERASRFTQTVRQGNSGTRDRAATVGPRRNGALLRVHPRSVYRLAPLRPDTQNERRRLLHWGNQKTTSTLASSVAVNWRIRNESSKAQESKCVISRSGICPICSGLLSELTCR